MATPLIDRTDKARLDRQKKADGFALGPAERARLSVKSSVSSQGPSGPFSFGGASRARSRCPPRDRFLFGSRAPAGRHGDGQARRRRHGGRRHRDRSAAALARSTPSSSASASSARWPRLRPSGRSAPSRRASRRSSSSHRTRSSCRHSRAADPTSAPRRRGQRPRLRASRRLHRPRRAGGAESRCRRGRADAGDARLSRRGRGGADRGRAQGADARSGGRGGRAPRAEYNQLRAQQGVVAAASRGVTASIGAQRAGWQQIGFNVGDAAASYASGTKILTIFAQQAGRQPARSGCWPDNPRASSASSGGRGCRC
jgi:hypothetical protein